MNTALQDANVSPNHIHHVIKLDRIKRELCHADGVLEDSKRVIDNTARLDSAAVLVDAIMFPLHARAKQGDPLLPAILPAMEAALGAYRDGSDVFAVRVERSKIAATDTTPEGVNVTFSFTPRGAMPSVVISVATMLQRFDERFGFVHYPVPAYHQLKVGGAVQTTWHPAIREVFLAYATDLCENRISFLSAPTQEAKQAAQAIHKKYAPLLDLLKNY